MNREQKTAAIAEIVDNINASEAVLVVDYRGLSVTQASELRNALPGQARVFRAKESAEDQLAQPETGHRWRS